MYSHPLVIDGRNSIIFDVNLRCDFFKIDYIVYSPG